MKTKYVLGFAFSQNQVILIKKQKPEWQRGLLNGVGGKIEGDESPKKAMEREYLEEAGYYTTDWIPFCEMEGEHFVVYCFKLFSDVVFDNSKSMESEEILKIPIPQLHDRNCISNIPWLVYMALDKEKHYSYIKYES